MATKNALSAIGKQGFGEMMKLVAIDKSDNSVLVPNQWVKTPKGEWLRFIRATRANSSNKDGLVVVEHNSCDGKYQREYYARVINARVENA